MSLKCEICGTSEGRIIQSKKFNKTLCRKHYLQISVYGKTHKTYYSENEIIIYDEFAEMMLYEKPKKGVDIINKTKTLINLEDIEKITKVRWYCSKNGYVIADKNSKHEKLYLHRYVLNYSGSMVVDHINRNPLDNRKENLRICEQKYNVLNKRIPTNNTSGIAGVSWNKEKSKWEVYVAINKKRIRLGCYSDLNDAKYIRYKKELEVFKEFTPNREEKEKFIKEYELLRQNQKVGVACQ